MSPPELKKRPLLCLAVLADPGSLRRTQPGCAGSLSVLFGVNSTPGYFDVIHESSFFLEQSVVYIEFTWLIIVTIVH